MSDRFFAEIAELAARYFCGWTPKEVGIRRFPAFEAQVRAAAEREKETKR